MNEILSYNINKKMYLQIVIRKFVYIYTLIYKKYIFNTFSFTTLHPISVLLKNIKTKNYSASIFLLIKISPMYMTNILILIISLKTNYKKEIVQDRNKYY